MHYIRAASMRADRCGIAAPRKARRHSSPCVLRMGVAVTRARFFCCSGNESVGRYRARRHFPVLWERDSSYKMKQTLRAMNLLNEDVRERCTLRDWVGRIPDAKHNNLFD